MATLFKTILCPIDLEAESLTALEIARRIAEQNGATICLLYVVAPPLPGPLEPVPNWEKTVNGRLSRIAKQRFGDKMPCKIMTVHGRDPAEAIIRAADTGAADLIVMATHGHQGLDRVLLGSVAE